MPKWTVYMVKCRDGSLYTGMTNSIEDRLEKHNSGKGAKYTRSRLPVRLVWSKMVKTESAARKLEAEIKKWTRLEKEALFA